MGVIANLAVYFAIHTLFSRTVTLNRTAMPVQVPDVATLRPVAFGIEVVAAVLLFKVQWSVLRTLGVCAALGLAAGLAGLPIT